MATAPLTNKPLNVAVRAKIADGAGNTTNYYALDPRKTTAILVNKNSQTATISFTVDINDVNGDRLTDLEAAGVLWNDVSSDANDYFAGDNQGLTGVKVNSNPSGAAVEYSIIQF